ncbi:MAG TPA: endonuclease NucS [Syntrophorhabdaceae bacterium]|nr:MAG: hypothetical protein BWX92_01017 [Deltaproteobacteria bacterium ADurb.Bin135]HNQ63082.1 endonuclease NucS [Syntrophorhabdaceae bacterium]
MKEKYFEDVLTKYTELVEDDLTLLGRQVTVCGRRIDLLFEDRNKRKLIVELKIGPIKDQHIGQTLSYQGMLLKSDDPTVRVMLIGNSVAQNVRTVLDHYAIAWKEIKVTQIKEFLSSRKDDELLKRIDEEFIELPSKIKKRPLPKTIVFNPVGKSRKINVIESLLDLIKQSGHSGHMVTGQALCIVQSGIRNVIVTLRINGNNDFEVRIASLESEQSERLAVFLKEKGDSLNDLTKLTFCERNESIRNPDRYKIAAEFLYDEGNYNNEYLNRIKNKYIEIIKIFNKLWNE